MSQSPTHTVDTLGMGSAIHAATEVAIREGIPETEWPQSIVKYATERVLETRAPKPAQGNVTPLVRPSRSLASVVAAHLDLVGDMLLPGAPGIPHQPPHQAGARDCAVTHDTDPGTQNPSDEDSSAIAWALGAGAVPTPATGKPLPGLAVDPMTSSRVLAWIKDRAAEAHAANSAALRPGTEKGLKALADAFRDAVHHRLATEDDALRVFRDTCAATGGWPYRDPAVPLVWTDRAVYLDNALARNVGRRTLLWLKTHAAVMAGRGTFDPDLVVQVPVQPQHVMDLVLAENRPRRGRGSVVWMDIGDKGGPKPTTNNVRALLAYRGLTLAFDRFSERHYVYGQPDTVDMTDAVMEAWWIEAGSHGLHVSPRMWKETLTSVCKTNTFDSLIDEIRSHVWDGQPRLDTWLTDILGAEDTPLTRAVGRKWLIGAVLRGLCPGAKFDNVLVLEGAEGMSKSSTFAVLAGPGRFSDGLDIAGDPKRLIEESAGVWIGELAELAALGRHDAERTTAAISRSRDVARKAYDRLLSSVPRRFVLGGTTNRDSQYLMTQEGNRRYWAVAVKQAAVGVLRRVRGQLIAEAAAAVDAGELPMLPAELIPAAREVQESRRASDLWENVLADALRDVPAGTYMRVVEPFAIVGKDLAGTSNADARRMTAVMKRMGWRRHRIVIEQKKDVPHVYTNIPEGEPCGRSQHGYVFSMGRCIPRAEDDVVRARQTEKVLGSVDPKLRVVK